MRKLLVKIKSITILIEKIEEKIPFSKEKYYLIYLLPSFKAFKAIRTASDVELPPVLCLDGF